MVKLGCLALIAVALIGMLLQRACDQDAPVGSQGAPEPMAISPSHPLHTANQTTYPSLESIDQTPAWYQGSKPWSSIGREGREQLLRMRAHYEANEASAHETSGTAPDAAAKAGRRLIDRTVTKYALDDYFRTPDTFGSRMVLWLPERAWDAFSAVQKQSIEAFMKSNYANWGIGVGRVQGREVLFDRLVVEQ